MYKTNIEWCDSSWNPISGCKFGCEFCYAKKTAARFTGCEVSPDGSTNAELVYLTERQFYTDKRGNRRGAAYPFGFTPTFHEYRLADLTTKGLGETIFVGSMADMFGPWIPDEWIEKIFKACIEAPNHRYLFLTKNPARYLELATKEKLPMLKNFWYGTTTTDPYKPYFYAEGYNTFLSIEPILDDFGEPEGFPNKLPNWVIFGAETGNRADKVVPKREWIEDAVKLYQREGIPIFMKDSLKPIWGEEILTQFPWNK